MRSVFGVRAEDGPDPPRRQDVGGMGVDEIQEGEERAPRLPAPRQPVEEFAIHVPRDLPIAVGKLPRRPPPDRQERRQLADQLQPLVDQLDRPGR